MPPLVGDPVRASQLREPHCPAGSRPHPHLCAATAARTTPGCTEERPNGNHSPAGCCVTVSTPASREASRIQRRGKEEREETLRDAAQGHQDARRLRLEAYVESLRLAVSTSPSPEQTARLERQLDHARRDAAAAAQTRVPRAGTSPVALAARALVRPSHPLTTWAQPSALEEPHV